MRLDAAKKQDVVKQDIVTVTIQTNLRQGEAVVKEEVVTLTARIETNLRQGDLETEVDDTKGDLTEKSSFGDAEDSVQPLSTCCRAACYGASISQLPSELRQRRIVDHWHAPGDQE